MSVLSDTVKGILICFVIFLLWSFGCFGFGYLLSNSRATEQLNNANRQLEEQQQKYDNLIRETEERIRETEQRISSIREELSGKVADNGQTITELSNLIEQIKRQRIDI